MSSAEVRARFTHPVLKVVADYSEVWFRERDSLTFHDPLAAVGIFSDDVLTYKNGSVDVNLCDEDTPGRTEFTHSAAATSFPHQIAAEVQPDRFFKHYFSVFA
jgi:purine nucleosidase